MGTPYSMNGFFGVWSEALQRDEPTVAFEIKNGRGRFLFMMFFDPEDEKTKDKLLLFLQNTRYMLKLYGFHEKGDFRLFLDDWQVEKIKRELQLDGGSGPAFDIVQFIEGLNASIPQSVPLADKIMLLRENRTAYQDDLGNILDFYKKTELIGEKQLPSGQSPRERTLRKLYLYCARSPEDVAAYIDDLKRRNATVCWREPGASK
ncbi:hypothetical protein [Burkholderia thailandensis]|uniref:hypothetical protein n=1 Tax=Burkholderia thailandensis TaxID=57975 RepID=UPI0022ABFF48|nr:hypothetical protein [Burkholderia thailandensis]MCZ2903322.1 hypothetical protein [Burkholderia thailandensis]MDD1484315.1 hypothetical protein [Burkholderia thailandensis]MDD1490297.1 hypothetical protein [Burkholderia thailandensis]MDD1496515.1 hypothetical protein [Burkholderia thailandensis]